MQDRRFIEQQDKDNAEQFLNTNTGLEFARESESGWSKLKNTFNDNKGNIALGAAGLGLGAAAGHFGNEYLNDQNIEDLQTGEKTIDSLNNNLTELRKADISNHPEYDSHIQDTNKDVQDILKRIQDTPPTDDNVGDVANSKERLAKMLYADQDDGSTIHSTLNDETRKALQNSGVIKGFSDDKMWHDVDNRHEDIQDDMDSIQDRRDDALDRQRENDPLRQQVQSNIDANQAASTAQLQNNNAFREAIAQHGDSKLQALGTGATAGAAVAAGIKAKSNYNKNKGPDIQGPREMNDIEKNEELINQGYERPAITDPNALVGGNASAQFIPRPVVSSSEDIINKAKKMGTSGTVGRVIPTKTDTQPHVSSTQEIMQKAEDKSIHDTLRNTVKRPVYPTSSQAELDKMRGYNNDDIPTIKVGNSSPSGGFGTGRPPFTK